MAHSLVKAGVDTVIVDKRDVANGSTSASTALIQYEIDIPLFKLIRMRGERDAVCSYGLCFEAIAQIEKTVRSLKTSCRFKRRNSLYLARSSSDLGGLKLEFAARRKFGYELAFLTRAEVEERFAFSAPGALFSQVAAEIDPFRFTQELIKDAIERGARVFTPVMVRAIEPSRNRVTLKLDSTHRIVAKKVIVAAGYESIGFLRRKLVRLRSTYVLTTHPVARFDGWPGRCLIWECGRPYHYLRTTHDRRILIGGRDGNFVTPEKRDAMLGHKASLLRKKLDQMFPGMGLKPAFAWAGTFGDTKDGLPHIGTLPSSDRILFTLCYGANGTNFAMIGAHLARDWVRQRPNKDARLFALDR